jgi:transcriptional regulator with XRE-family HTH domain
MTHLSCHLVPGPLDWTLGDRLRKIRRHHRLSQREFAAWVGVRRSELARWEAGRSDGGPTMAVARRVCGLYDVPMNWLMGLVDHVGQASLDDTAG